MRESFRTCHLNAPLDNVERSACLEGIGMTRKIPSLRQQGPMHRASDLWLRTPAKSPGLFLGTNSGTPSRHVRMMWQGDAMATGSNKLQRSSSNRMIAGVCGGLAEWLGWNPTGVRVLYVVVSILSVAFPGILVYLVLWLLMPKASS